MDYQPTWNNKPGEELFRAAVSNPAPGRGRGGRRKKEPVPTKQGGTAHVPACLSGVVAVRATSSSAESRSGSSESSGTLFSPALAQSRSRVWVIPLRSLFSTTSPLTLQSIAYLFSRVAPILALTRGSHLMQEGLQRNYPNLETKCLEKDIFVHLFH